MPLQPGYGETPISGDELDALLPHVVDTLGQPVSKADIFDLESGSSALISGMPSTPE